MIAPNESTRPTIKTPDCIRDWHWIRHAMISRMLDVYCSYCGRWLMVYQKDGGRNLIQLYLNRMLIVQDKISKEKMVESKKFECPGCKKEIGILALATFPLDRRRAIRLNPEAITTRVL